jgi:phosphoglucomutase
MSSLAPILDEAVSQGSLMAEARDNILFLLETSGCEAWEKAAVQELVDAGEWTELTDRFYQTLKFGTGGLRGRTIGRIVTRAERGNAPRRRPAGISLRRHQRHEFL